MGYPVESEGRELVRLPGEAGKGASPEPAGTTPARHYWLPVLGLAILVGGFSLYSHWVPNKWLFGDGSFYMNVVRGLLENGSLRQDAMHPHSWYDQDLGWNHTIDAAWSNIALGRNGEWWPKHPILMPIVATPFVWAFGATGTLVFQCLCFLLLALLTFRVASQLASRPAALVATAAMLATPWIFDRVWGFNNDVFYSVLILAAVDAALREKAPLAGVLLGIGVFAKATNVFYGPPLLALFLMRKDWRGALRFSIAAAVPAVIYLGLNWYMYASPLATGYDRILVRIAGQTGTHSHSSDFHFSAIGPGLKRVLFGGEGFLGKFPLIFPAAAGLLVLAARKRWREALVFAWCIAVPIAFHAPYTWYRLEFNLPQIALAIAPLAAVLPPFAGPTEEDEKGSRVRWGRLGLLVVIVVLLIGGGIRRLVQTKHDYLWAELPTAQVFLGDIPCDYFNNQTERWECSHHDNDWLMTGRPLEIDMTYGGKREEVLLLHPHTSGRERRLEYPAVPVGTALEIRYGLTDQSRCSAGLSFKVLVGDQVVHEEDVRERGLKTTNIDTSAFVGQKGKVSFVVSSAAANWCIFGVNGGPRI